MSATLHDDSTRYCTQCNVLRPIASIMGGHYYTLRYCGHVVAIDNEVTR